MLERVMLIDDNKHDNFFHETAINDTGLAKEVVKYQSAEMALDFLSGVASANGIMPPLIFLDINMPGMSGWEFLQAYQQQVPSEVRKNSTIVMLTTSWNPNDMERAEKEPELSGFLNKPLTEEMFGEIVQKHFEKAA
jgi:CheY-like chemotaxis protein